MTQPFGSLLAGCEPVSIAENDNSVSVSGGIRIDALGLTDDTLARLFANMLFPCRAAFLISNSN